MKNKARCREKKISKFKELCQITSVKKEYMVIEVIKDYIQGFKLFKNNSRIINRDNKDMKNDFRP